MRTGGHTESARLAHREGIVLAQTPSLLEAGEVQSYRQPIALRYRRQQITLSDDVDILAGIALRYDAVILLVDELFHGGQQLHDIEQWKPLKEVQLAQIDVEVLRHPGLGFLRQQIQQVEVFLLFQMQGVLVHDHAGGTAN